MGIHITTERVTAEELIQRIQQELKEECKLRKVAELKNDELRVQLDGMVNLIPLLKEDIQNLRDEIAVLKGQKPRPKIPPSKLEGPKRGDKPKTPRGKHPRKNKKTSLRIDQEQIVQPQFIPKGAVFKGYKAYDVQDVVLKSNNTRFLIARWQLPDGTYMCGELPKGVHGHYGPDLIAYILNDYYACRVTEPLLLKKLHQQGVLISSGQLNNILIQRKDSFHEEKNELLAAGIEAHNQILTDDCGARHKGKNQYTNVIGNEWFSVFSTTSSKSRVNFFKLLQNGKHEYLLNEDTVAYLESVDVPAYLPGYIAISKGKKFTSLEAWQEFLAARNITKEKEIRLVTEAVLFSSIIENGIPHDLGVHGDDAGQFDAFIRSLCWIHEERHYRKFVPADEQARADLDQVRDKIWTIYKDLKTYRQNSNDKAKKSIEKQFDDLFLNLKTSSATLNKRLRTTHAKKEKLLRVLERPDTPLHNNSSETDARAAVVKRKVSGGTRSDAGRDARDTFLSLKQTCRKLGVNFMSFLKDRLTETFEIPRLNKLILEMAKSAKAPP